MQEDLQDVWQVILFVQQKHGRFVRKKQTSLSLQVTLMDCFKDVILQEKPGSDDWYERFDDEHDIFLFPKSGGIKTVSRSCQLQPDDIFFAKKKKYIYIYIQYIYICKTLSRRRSPSESISTMWVSKKGSNLLTISLVCLCCFFSDTDMH